MGSVELAMFILTVLQIIAASKTPPTGPVAEAAAEMQRLYNRLREAARQNQEWTPEQEAAMDARAEGVFASLAANPEINA